MLNLIHRKAMNIRIPYYLAFSLRTIFYDFSIRLLSSFLGGRHPLCGKWVVLLISTIIMPL
jgi:hypothetical protein